PGLNDDEILPILKAAGAAGAQAVSYTVVRLNGAIAEIFETWLREKFPDRAEKVLHLIAQCHDGRLNDSRWNRRIRGAGTLALTIERTLQMGKARYLAGAPPLPEYNLSLFRRGGQPSLFESTDG
ncbi:MAG: radical SAM protein, partial [Bacteroidia bacterium]|nr:radical SAM protein [Bacteroidia bacterium]